MCVALLVVVVAMAVVVRALDKRVNARKRPALEDGRHVRLRVHLRGHTDHVCRRRADALRLVDELLRAGGEELKGR